MAYKFVNADRLDADLTTVANAIRTKGGTAGQLAFPSGMVSAISAISTGVELNFEVVGNPKPQTAKENTIWLDTNVEITSYIFRATEPEAPADGSDGPVWILTGTSSTAEFNALKKNGIQVCPIYAKQYVSGAWVDVVAKSYQNGAWVDWWNGELYKNGNEYTSITGGFVGTGMKIGSDTLASVPTITRNGDSITFSGGCGISHTKNKIDLSEYNVINFIGDIPYIASAQWRGFGIWSSLDGSVITENRVATIQLSVNGTTDFTVDITALSGEYYVGFWTYATATVTVESLILS